MRGKAKTQKKSRHVEKKLSEAKEVGEALVQDMEAFKASKAFSNAKVAFATEAFIEGKKCCHQKVATLFSELDLPFMDVESDSKDD